ncbi:hypothetical protein H4I96_01753 [Botrytis cinerea]
MGDKPAKRSALVIGAGIYGLITAKTLLHDSASFFDSVELLERNEELGGVWANNRIYDGLTTNSPLLSYEIPDFPYSDDLRKTGRHVKAEEVNRYLQDYAEKNSLVTRIKFHHHVQEISWDSDQRLWIINGHTQNQSFCLSSTHLVICTGLYHAAHVPPSLQGNNVADFAGNVWHSSQVSNLDIQQALAGSGDIVVVGAGKSAIDLATLLAQGQWSVEDSPTVNLVYRQPHWLSPRNILHNTVAFEKILFCRFVNAWLPFANPPDIFHRYVADTALGRWCTRKIFEIVSWDFITSNLQQDLPQTIPNNPLSGALSGALHVTPVSYLESVRDRKIEIFEGHIALLRGDKAYIVDKSGSTQIVKADNVIVATGYNLSLPFLSKSLLEDLGLVARGDLARIPNTEDLPYIRLHRLVVPPEAIHQSSSRTTENSKPYRNIAFNGFAYSLLNPTVAFVTANWISDYFGGKISLPRQDRIEADISRFYSWQIESFGSKGAKGVHIGSHATLYTDLLLKDMDLQSGHVIDGGFVSRTIREWFRPMFPALYARVAHERLLRDKKIG